MASRKDQYKTNNGFGDITNNRAVNKKICDIKRKEQRVQNFTIKRKLELEYSTDETMDTHDKENNCKLLKWKAEKDKRKKVEQQQKKPPFKVGVVHHSYYSPIKDSVTLRPTKPCLRGQKPIKQSAAPSTKTTRAAQQQLSQKSMVSNNASKIHEVAGKKIRKNSDKNKNSFAPKNCKSAVPNGSKKKHLFDRAVMLDTYAQALMMVKKLHAEEESLSKRNSKSSHLENDAAEVNESDKTSDIDMANESGEAIALKVSSDEDEITFDDFVKEGQFLPNNQCSSTPITSLPSIALITAKEKTMTENQSNNEAEILSERNIVEIKAENETSKNTSSKQIEVAFPLRKDSLMLNNINSPKNPVFFSPYVVSSRGKSNARKEQMSHSINFSPSENISTKETVKRTLNMSIEKEEYTAQKFSFMLNKETDRLNELCKKWAKIKSELDITEDAQYQINQAIGQTNLLINKKFERFRGLILDCETGEGERLITCTDLQGFWDMTYMEVTNCDLRFKKLEKLRSNGWKEEEEFPVTKVVPSKKVKPKKKIAFKRKGSVQDFILAAKKKMKSKTGNVEILNDQMNESINKLKSVEKVNFNSHVISQKMSTDEEIQNKFEPAATLAGIDMFDTEYASCGIKAEKKLNFNKNSFLDSEFNLQCNTEQLNLSNVIKEKDDTLLNLETELVGNTSFKSEDMSLKESSNKFIQNETNIKILRNKVVVIDNSTRMSIARRSNKGLIDEDKDNQKENKTPVKLDRSSKFLEQNEPTAKEEPFNDTLVNLRRTRKRLSRKSMRLSGTSITP